MSKLERTAVVIPVKGSEPKRRLASILSGRERRQLQVAMLEDTLQTLIRARMIRDTFVVSSDPLTLEFARRFGARSSLEEADRGVNSAVGLGLRLTRKYASTMVIPADLPMLTEGDLKTAIELADEGAGVVISPSGSFNGTNLLLLKRTRFELHYEDDSFHRHLKAAIAARLLPAVYSSTGVGFDIDTPEDVEEFLRLGWRGSTLTFLGRTLRKPARLRPRVGKN